MLDMYFWLPSLNMSPNACLCAQICKVVKPTPYQIDLALNVPRLVFVHSLIAHWMMSVSVYESQPPGIVLHFVIVDLLLPLLKSGIYI